MVDFNFVTTRLATGGSIASREDAQALIQAGITHVIDCTAQLDPTGTSLVVLYNPTDDDGQPKPAEWFSRSLSFALGALYQPHNKVYAHCAAGFNRGPSTAYAILRALGWSAEEAEAQIRKHRTVGLAYKKDADAAVIALGYA